MTDSGPAINTDRELYREPDKGGGDFYSDSIHVTENGGIGINVGGSVIVKPLRDWHALASRKYRYDKDHRTLIPADDEPSGNLAREFPAVALEGWEGCTHLDCLNECDTSKYHCERLARFLRTNAEGGDDGRHDP